MKQYTGGQGTQKSSKASSAYIKLYTEKNIAFLLLCHARPSIFRGTFQKQVFAQSVIHTSVILM